VRSAPPAAQHSAARPSFPGVVEVGNTSYISTELNAGYSFDGTTVTALGTMPNASTIALYGDRLVVVPVAATNTVRYSDAASFNSWPVGNTLTVGDTDPIGAIISQRAHLAILKSGSSFYVLTGVPGVNDTLRAVQRANGVTTASLGGAYSAAARRADDVIYYVPGNGNFPVTFDGARTVEFDNIITADFGGQSLAVVPLLADDQTGIVINQAAVPADTTPQLLWVRSKGAWTKHTLGVTVINKAAAATHTYPQNGTSDGSLLRTGSMLCFTDGGGASATPKFYGWQPFMDRPGLEVNPLSISAERAGDASASPVSGSVTFPEQHTDDGSDIQVRGVIVHFRKWNTGGSLTNHFDLAVNTLRSYETPGTASSATASWDEDVTLSSTGGTLQSKYFSFGDQGRGGGFQLAFTNVRGIAFQRIQVVTETYPARF
jgi:hypothetical protein